MLDYKLIGLRIREKRKNCGYTQEELAEALGISATYLSRIENGRRNLSLDLLVDLCRELRVGIDSIIFGADDMFIGTYAAVFENLFENCNKYEIHLIIELAEALKSILKNSRKYGQ